MVLWISDAALTLAALGTNSEVIFCQKLELILTPLQHKEPNSFLELGPVEA